MFPVRRYPHPVPVFGVPMAVPIYQPGDSPLVCASWHPSYTPLLLGAMMSLWQESTWKGNDNTVNISLGRIYELSRRIGNASPCSLGDINTETFNFATSDYGWTVPVGGFGTWTADVGWRSDSYTAGGLWYTRLNMSLDLPSQYHLASLTLTDAVLTSSSYVGVPRRLTLGMGIGQTSPFFQGANIQYDFDLAPASDNLPVYIQYIVLPTSDAWATQINLVFGLGPFPSDPSGFDLALEVHALTVEWKSILT